VPLRVAWLTLSQAPIGTPPAFVMKGSRQTAECAESPQHLFTTKKGGRQPDPGDILRMVNRCAAKVRTKNVITRHTVRHPSLANLYRKTSSTRLNQKVPGYATLAITRIYTRIVNEELEGTLGSFRCSSRRTEEVKADAFAH